MIKSLLTFLLLALCTVSSYAQSPAGAAIVVTAPKAGDVLLGGVPFQIKATYNGDLTSPIIYEYTVDNGGFWMYIGESSFTGGTPGSSTFTWQNPPDISVPEAQIRLRDAAGVIGTSGVFQFKAAAKLEGLTVNDGFNPIPLDTDIQITWTVYGEPGLIDLSYNVDGKKTVIANNLPQTTQSYTWRSPKTPMTDVYFLLQADKASELEVGPFRIQAVAGISNVIVNGGVTPLPAGQDVVISWTVTGEPGLIDLWYEVGGFPYVIANDLAGSTTTYTWKTPLTTQPEIYIVLDPADAQKVEVGPFALQEIASVGKHDDASFKVSVYPNPAMNVLSVQAELAGAVNVTLTDLTGKQLIARSAHGGEKVELDVSTLASGSYMLSVQQGESTASRMVTIQR